MSSKARKHTETKNIAAMLLDWGYTEPEAVYVAELLVESVYKYMVRTAAEEYEDPKWENSHVMDIYTTAMYRIKSNIFLGSSVYDEYRERKPKDMPSVEHIYLPQRLMNWLKIRIIEICVSGDLAAALMKRITHTDPQLVGNMTSFELNPDLSDNIVKYIESRKNQKIEYKYSELYKCSKCGAKKTQHYEVQTRSGDEGGTLIVNCMQCPHTWRIYG